MSDPSWAPLFRTPRATVTKVFHSAAFADSRVRARTVIDDPMALRALAGAVEPIDLDDAPLSGVADRVRAAVRFLLARAERLETDPDAERDGDPGTAHQSTSTDAGGAARRRLVVAALHYLVTPVDLVPDFQIGGYVDDALLLSWVFGATREELEPFLATSDGLDPLDEPD